MTLAGFSIVHPRKMLFGLAIGAFLALTGTANADVERVVRTDDGDQMTFRDDLLNSDIGLPKGGSIVVRPRAYRTGLLRPRAHFVPELLKSVERL